MQKTLKPVNLDSVIQFERKLGPDLSGEFRGHATYLSTCGQGVQERMAQNLGIADAAETALKFEGKLSGGLQREYRERILPFLTNAGEGTRERLHQAWAQE